MQATPKKIFSSFRKCPTKRTAVLPHICNGPVINSRHSFVSDTTVKRTATCACGGGCPRCSGPLSVQAKLTIGQPGDRYEREADSVADRVMRMPEAEIRRKPTCAEESCPQSGDEEIVQPKPLIETLTPVVQREVESAAEEDEVQDQYDGEEEPVQAKKDRGGALSVSPAARKGMSVLRGGGLPLPASSRAFFEPRFGADFSGVRIHIGSRAADVSNSIHAKAFTLGQDVVFGAGQYAPESTEGKRLMAHELTHVVQQNKDVRSSVRLSGQHAPQAGQKVQRKKLSAEECKQKGFTVDQCKTVDQDFYFATTILQSAIAKLKSNKNNKFVKKALKLFFNLETDAHNKQIEQNLMFVLELVKLWRIGSFYASVKCDSNTIAYTEKIDTLRKYFEKVYGKLNPAKGQRLKAPFLINYAKRYMFKKGAEPHFGYASIHLCGAKYFKKDPVERARTLIHEGAHLIGVGKPKSASDEIYFKSGLFYMLKSSVLLRNADSHAYFATALAFNKLPFVSPVHMKQGFGGGIVFPLAKRRKVGWYGTIYYDVISKKPILRIVYPFGRISFTYLSTLPLPQQPPTAYNPLPSKQSKANNITLLTGILGGIRIVPKKRYFKTNWHVTVGGGPIISYTEVRDEKGNVKKTKVGVQAFVAGGFRWRYVGASLGVSYLRLPNVPGFEHSLQVGGRVAFTFNWP